MIRSVRVESWVLGFLRNPLTWLVAVEVAFALATSVMIPATARWATTYAGASLLAGVADLAAGIGLMVAGTAVLFHRRRPTIGIVAVLAGAAWLSADWIGWQDGNPIVRTMAMLAAPFFLPLILHLVAAYRSGAASDRISQLAVSISYAAVSVVTLLAVLFRNPLTDPNCWNNCTDDVLLVRNQPNLQPALEVARPASGLVVGIALIVLVALRLARATPTERRRIYPVFVPALFVGATATAQTVLLLAMPREGPQIAQFAVLFQLRSWTAALLALGLVWVVIRDRRSRSAIARLARDLGDAPQPGSLAPALGGAMNDPTLQVAYWIPRSGRLVDGAGQTVPAPVSGDQRTVTRIARGGRTVAFVVQDASSADGLRLEREMGPAATLALENERLRVELLSQVEDLRASRARIVAKGDAERARLERDLHDGGQQRLILLLHELGVAREQAVLERNDDLADRLDVARRETSELVSDLRELAHGIHPAVLTERGLRAALLSLADTAPLPVKVQGSAAGRFPRGAEEAAYAIVASALEQAARVGSEGMTVSIIASDGALMIEIDGAGSGPFPHIADRVASAEGRLAIGGSTLEIWIPCA
ncbi:MAG TPA: histidine kinase [Candidatus Limnocylindrales bacterium]